MLVAPKSGSKANRDWQATRRIYPGALAIHEPSGDVGAMRTAYAGSAQESELKATLDWRAERCIYPGAQRTAIGKPNVVMALALTRSNAVKTE